MSWVAGIDGCKGAWVAVLWDGNSTPECIFLKAFAEVETSLAHAKVLAVDIPIGLPDKSRKGGRDCDKAARKLLKYPRSSSVFSPPSRASLKYAHSFEQAKKNNGDVSLTIQAFSLIPKIKEVDEQLRQSGSLRARVFEVHPEVSFWAANGNQAMRHSKKKAEGREERFSILKNIGLDVHSLSAKAKNTRNNTRNARRMEMADLLDAAIAAWSAWRILKGDAIGVLQEDLPVDRYGLEMQKRF